MYAHQHMIHMHYFAQNLVRCTFSISRLPRERVSEKHSSRRLNEEGQEEGPETRYGTPAPKSTARYLLALALLLALGSLLGLPGTSLSRLYSPLPPGEHRIHKVHVCVHRLPGERLRGLRLALLLVGQLLGGLPVLLGLGVQVVDGLVEEDLGDLGVALLGGDAAFGDRLVGLNEGVGKLLGGLIYPLLALLIDHSARYSPSCCYV